MLVHHLVLFAQQADGLVASEFHPAYYVAPVCFPMQLMQPQSALACNVTKERIVELVHLYAHNAEQVPGSM